MAHFGDVVVIRAALTPAIVNTITCAEQQFTVAGINIGDVLLSVQKPTEQAGLGICHGRISAVDGKVCIKFANPTAGNITPTAGETYTFVVLRGS